MFTSQAKHRQVQREENTVDTGLTGEMLTTLNSSEDDKASNQYEDAENMANSTHHTKHQEQDTTDPELHFLTHSEVPGLTADWLRKLPTG